MSVVHGIDSEYAKEMRKWNADFSEYGPPGRPRVFQPYPTWMHRAGRNEQGKSDILESRVAADETEQRNLESRGFVAGGQQVALEALAASEQEAAILHAELNAQVRKMGDGAQQEFAQAEAAMGAKHIASVPVTPIKPRRKPGPKPKPATV